jgi:hypothetical protein
MSPAVEHSLTLAGPPGVFGVPLLDWRQPVYPLELTNNAQGTT